MEVASINQCNKTKCSENSLIELSSDISIETNGEEKCDVVPENSKKSCDSSPEEETKSNSLKATNKDVDCKLFISDKSCDNIKNEVDTSTSDSSKSLAFTIDFNEGKVIDSKKYNQIVERFQKRHTRGASLPKFETKTTSNTACAISKTKPPLKKSVQKSTEALEQKNDNNSPVKLREKNLLHTSNSSDNHRHSWSPRTSVRIPQVEDDFALPSQATFKPKSSILQKAFQDVQRNLYSAEKQLQMSSAESTEDFACNKLPLEFVKNSDDDSLSDAGTYTLDGDNYTEEQKAKMSIDKMSKLAKESCQQVKLFQTSDIAHKTSKNYCDARQVNVESNLEIVDLENTSEIKNVLEKRRKNVLEVTYATDLVLDKPKTSYLEKIKSKVKTIGDRAFHKNKSPEKVIVPQSLDLGSFTSITSSGVFSKKLNDNCPPKITRRNSLTKSQIDSSEYIQRNCNINNKLLNSYTDYEKARHHEYKLNIFSPNCTTDAEKENANERLGIETAETKNDWIQEWAKNARKNTNQNQFRKYNERTKNDFSNKMYYDEFGENLNNNYSTRNIERFRDNICDYDYRASAPNAPLKHSQSIQNYYKKHHRKMSNECVGSEFESDELSSPSEKTHNSDRNYETNSDRDKYLTSNLTRPPISPTKIPSPMHSMVRARSSSINRSLHGSSTDLDDTEMYLHKTAAAISTLQNIHRNNNSPKSPSSPAKTADLVSKFTSSPSVRRHNMPTTYSTEQSLYNAARLQQLHKRNLSLDGSEYRPKMLINNEMSHSYNSDGMNGLLKHHTRHNSFEDKLMNHKQQGKSIDQTFSPQMALRNNISTKYQPPANNKLKNGTNQISQSNIKRSSSFSIKQLTKPLGKTPILKMAPKTNKVPLQKSASSNSFKNMTSRYVDDLSEFYLNDEDDLNPNMCSSDSELSEPENEKELITNTRYNKAFLIRMEQNKQKATGIQKQGVAACPNTPELPRRDARVRASLRDRASMPRDSSLSRMKQDIPSLSSTKKVLTNKEKESNKKVLPKYLDISKYKPNQGNSFLKRDESKSTLINKEIKRSSSAFVGLNKTDTGRSSIRSVKSASNTKPTTPGQNSSSREAELAMWRRRSSYDPMKAAAEGKKKQEEARKVFQPSKYNESSVVLRSQSFHNGVGQTNLRCDLNDDIRHRWTLISTESSEDEFIENY